MPRGEMVKLQLPDEKIEEPQICVLATEGATRIVGSGSHDEPVLDDFLDDQVTLGDPVVTPFGQVPDGLTAGLPDYLQSIAHSFHWVILALTFRERPPRSVVEAVLRVNLSTDADKTAGPLPSAVLMVPADYAQALTVRKKVSVSLGATGVFQPRLSGEKEKEHVEKESHLEAQNLQTPNPLWHFRDHRGVHLHRSRRLFLLVGAAHGIRINGKFGLAVKVKRGSWIRVFDRIERVDHEPVNFGGES